MTTLPEAVLHFVENCIDSVEQLSVLLLLYSQPERVWSTEEIAANMRSTDVSIAKRLDDLYKRQVIIRKPELSGRHQFSPFSNEVSSIVTLLSEQNRIRPYRLVEVIYSKPTRALRAFSDAFKFRGNK